MNIERISDTELSQYYINKELIKETADQIIKDFSAFSFLIGFSGNFEKAYHDLYDQLVPIIEELLSNDYGQLMNVLYRIDVKEGELLRHSQENPDLNLANTISQLIIKRELIKVITRRIYRDMTV